MTVKAHEDKTYPGAFIASLTIPWGQAVNASGGGGGYHFVWARDAYEQVTGLLAAGDGGRAGRRHLAVHPAAAGGRALPAELRIPTGPRTRPTCSWTRPHTRSSWPSRSAASRRRCTPTTSAKAADYLVAGGSDDAAGALGGDRRLLALHDRRHDRRR